MKKHNLLKTIGIFFLVLVALTWVIPTGSFSGSEFTKGTTDPIGFVDLFRLPLMTMTTFFQYALVFLAIGGLYEVLNKTGVYVPFVNRIAKKWKGKESTFLAMVITIFAVLASLSGLTLPLFVFVPFVVAILLVMGVSKLTALASTVGAILVGMLGSTYGFNISGYINHFLSLDVNNQIASKIILLAILVFLLVMFVIKHAKIELSSKKENKKEAETKKTSKKASTKSEEVVTVKKSKEIDIPFYQEEYQNKKSVLPLVIVMIILILLSMIMMFNWYYGFKLTFFQDIYTSLMDIKIGNYPIVSNLIGTMAQFGYWSNYELTVVLMIASIVIGWIYSIKWNDIIDSFLTGAKKMIGVAFYASLCSVLFAVILSSTGGTIYDTIVNFFLGMTKSFNVFTTMITSLIGGFFYNDFSYLVNGLASVSTAKFDAASLEIVGLSLQSMYGLAMLLLPTSMILIAGLRYLEVSYKEWIKYIWKFLLSVFVIIVAVLGIATLFM